MQITNLEILVNVSYILILLSFLMRDILLLRSIYVCGAVLLIAYFYLESEPLWIVILWNSVYLLINLFWIVKLLFDRRPWRFTEEEKQIWDSTLYRISPKHARTLFKSAEYKTFSDGSLIVEEGTTLDHLVLIVDGEAELDLDNKVVERIGSGHFIGSAMLLESTANFPSVATIHATVETRVMIWKRQDLLKMIKNDNEFSVAFEATLGLDISHLLARAWGRLGNVQTKTA